MKQTKTCISVKGGNFFDFMNPKGYDYDIEVIAHSLSNLCRYTGHSNSFYSVAEHSVYVSQLVPPEYALEGLLHDASEAFCGDVASPLKALIPDYRVIEDSVQDAIADYFNLMYPFPDCIHLADKRIYKAELKQITDSKDTMWYPSLKAPKIKINCWSPSNAKNHFINRFYELTENDKRYGPLYRQGTPESAPTEPYRKGFTNGQVQAA